MHDSPRLGDRQQSRRLVPKTPFSLSVPMNIINYMLCENIGSMLLSIVITCLLITTNPFKGGPLVLLVLAREMRDERRDGNIVGSVPVLVLNDFL